MGFNFKSLIKVPSVDMPNITDLVNSNMKKPEINLPNINSPNINSPKVESPDKKNNFEPSELFDKFSKSINLSGNDEKSKKAKTDSENSLKIGIDDIKALFNKQSENTQKTISK